MCLRGRQGRALRLRRQLQLRPRLQVRHGLQLPGREVAPKRARGGRRASCWYASLPPEPLELERIQWKGSFGLSTPRGGGRKLVRRSDRDDQRLRRSALVAERRAPGGGVDLRHAAQRWLHGREVHYHRRRHRHRRLVRALHARGDQRRHRHRTYNRSHSSHPFPRSACLHRGVRDWTYVRPPSGRDRANLFFAARSSAAQRLRQKQRQPSPRPAVTG
jgi:hypothetical protein